MGNVKSAVKKGLMTPGEFSGRLPETYREAILLSIEKWERAIAERNWRTLCCCGRKWEFYLASSRIGGEP